jgi:hypothetical protein
MRRFTCLLLLLPLRALAWGAPGHEIAAAIAESRLTPEARAMVHEIVSDTPLSDPSIATWADALRDPKTRPFHYVNIPFGSGKYDAARDCPRGACAVAEIQRAAAQLAGRGSALERSDALRWLVHVVADIHQPLHAGDGWDRGGNETMVRLGRRKQPTNLHRVWDSDVVKPLVHRKDVLGAARALSAEISRSDAVTWAADLDPASWANESNREAKAIYAEVNRRPQDTGILSLPADYPRRESPRAAAALQRAGVRLAALLDDIARRRSHGVR